MFKNNLCFWALTFSLALIPDERFGRSQCRHTNSNHINKTYIPAWAHVNVLDVGVGYVALEFVSERGFWSCFEYRTDGDTSPIVDQWWS